MDREGRFWIAFWALVTATVCVVAICITVGSVANSRIEQRESLSRIEHGCKEPPHKQSVEEYHETIERIDHGCLAPEVSAK